MATSEAHDLPQHQMLHSLETSATLCVCDRQRCDGEVAMQACVAFAKKRMRSSSACCRASGPKAGGQEVLIRSHFGLDGGELLHDFCTP